MSIKGNEILKKRNMILNDNVWKIIFIVSFPIAISQFIQVFYNIIDTYFASFIGVNEIASVSFVIYFINFIRSAGNGLSVAGTTIIAKKIGAKKFEDAKKTIIQLFIVVILIGIATIIFIFPFSKQLLYLLGATDNIIEPSNTYLRLNIISIFLLLISNSFLSIKKAIGSTNIVLILNLLALLIKGISCYIFICIFNLGIEGLVYSTIISRLMLCIVAIYDYIFKNSMLKIVPSDIKIVKPLMIGLIVLGVPLAIERSTMSFGNILLNKMAIIFGSDFIAARGIVNRMISLGFSVLTGFGNGLVPIISQNLGANNIERVKEIIKKSYILIIFISTSLFVIILTNKYTIANFFLSNDSKQLLGYIVEGFSIQGFLILGWGIYQVSLGIFKGFGDTKNILTISLIRLYIFRLPLVYILINYTPIAHNSIWWGVLLSNYLGVVLILIMVYFKYYRNDNMSTYINREENSI